MMIDPATLAFDFDGVLADTMSLFLEIARDEYNINGIGYDDITCYELDKCLNIKPEIIAEIIDRLLKGEYSQPLHPMAGAAEVLVQISHYRNPIPLVTSRPYPGPIKDWIINNLLLDPGSFDIIATGAPEAKADELLNRGTFKPGDCVFR
jgi:phosphoglycolate phosphatase-like HAD superfamily hydrolase